MKLYEKQSSQDIKEMFLIEFGSLIKYNNGTLMIEQLGLTQADVETYSRINF